MKSPHEGSNSGQSCSLEVKTIGVSLSKGVQVDESFVVDREVIIILWYNYSKNL